MERTVLVALKQFCSLVDAVQSVLLGDTVVVVVIIIEVQEVLMGQALNFVGIVVIESVVNCGFGAVGSSVGCSRRSLGHLFLHRWNSILQSSPVQSRRLYIFISVSHSNIL